MTPLEALLQIKQMFAEMPPVAPPTEVAPAEAPVEPAAPEYKEYVLKSGAKVKIDKLEVGGNVVLVDDMGNESPAPQGEHELADGTIITLDENSVIVEIASPVEETPEAEPQVDMAAQKIAELEAQIEELKKNKKGMEVKMAEVESKFSQAIQELSDVVIGLINTPSAEATEKPKQVFGKVVPSKDSRIDSFLSKYARN